ncbi:MAG: DUF1835 domain-containing protein, partial [Bacteroidota bacterium]
MSHTYHILTGDALREQLSDSLTGEIIVARECLVDGPVAAENLAALFDLRAKFLSKEYGACTVEEYHAGSAGEFAKVQTIPSGSTINLWFEDDLFCQVNLWFTAYLIHHYTEGCSTYLVRPREHTQYGFGGLSLQELHQALADRQAIDDLQPFARLWKAYQADDAAEMR